MKASTIFLALLLGTQASSSLAEAPAPRYPVSWKHDQRIATYWGFLPTDVLAELVGPEAVVIRCGTLLSFGNAAITYLFRPGKSKNSHRLVAGTSDRIKIGILENHEELESAVLRLMKGLPVTADGRIKTPHQEVTTRGPLWSKLLTHPESGKSSFPIPRSLNTSRETFSFWCAGPSCLRPTP